MRDPRDIPGFLAPLRQALTQPILLGGASRSYAIVNGTIATVVAFAGQPLWGVGVGIVGHGAGVYLARRDADAVEVLKRAMKIKGRLEC